jgi:nicotinamide mononucleotide adenylyltransferase
MRQRNVIIIPNHIVNDVSSSSVRRLLSYGHSIKYLVADSVDAYIKVPPPL